MGCECCCQPIKQEDVIRNQIIECEKEVLKLTGIPEGFFMSKFVTCDVAGFPDLKIWTHIISN